MEEKKKDKNETSGMSAAEHAEVVEILPANTDPDDEEISMIVRLKKPYFFEGKEYREIDLSGLEDLSAEDMIACEKYLDRTSRGIKIMPELSVEYACVFAAKAAKLPVEFFTRLPAWAATRVKNRVMGFLFGAA